jgi:phospholipid/cholesterol/gamma-HCH transport system substrate-binding protein
MELNPAAKVGIVTVVAGLLFLLSISQIGRFGSQDGDEYRVLFESVGGLQERSPVYLAGVPIGFVKNLELAENNKVQTTIQITREDVALYRARDPETDAPGTYYVYTITGNLLGDRWMEIKPGPVEPGTERLANGQLVVGETPVTLDDLAREGYEVMGQLSQSVDALNGLVADEKFQSDIKLTVENFREISGNLKGVSSDAKIMVAGLNDRVSRLSDSLETVVTHVDQTVISFSDDARVVGQDLKTFSGTANRMLVENEPHLDTIVMNLRSTSASLKKAMRAVEALADNEQLNEDVVAAVENLRRTSEEIQGIATDIRSISSDPEVQEDLRETLTNAKQASASAARVMGRVEKISDGVGSGKLIGLEAEQQWDLNNGQASTNVNAYLLPEGPYGAKVGVDSIGQDNLVNLQAMRNWEKFRLRAGVVRSQFGLGADARLFDKRLELNLDAYDTSDPQVDLLAKYIFGKGFYVQGGYRNLFNNQSGNRPKDAYPVIGAGKRF